MVEIINITKICAAIVSGVTEDKNNLDIYLESNNEIIIYAAQSGIETIESFSKISMARSIEFRQHQKDSNEMVFVTTIFQHIKSDLDKKYGNKSPTWDLEPMEIFWLIIEPLQN